MAKPIPATPTLAGKDAEALLADLYRAADPRRAARNARFADMVRRAMRGETISIQGKEVPADGRIGP